MSVAQVGSGGIAEKHRARMAARSRDAFSAAAEIGEIPKVVKPWRRAACAKNLHAFLVKYFPHSTGLKPFSNAHKAAIERMQLAILEGGRFLNIFPRGFAKTTISENAVIWATFYGHRKFVPFFGANATAASMSLDSITREIIENDLLFEDFPEICLPFRALEGKTQRCRTQTYQGELTYIRQTKDMLVFPEIPDSRGAQACIMLRSLKGGTRGLKFKRSDGTQQRPDLVVIDDPQDDETAASDLQVDKLLNTIKKSILRLGGHDREIAVFMNATPIEEGDLVFRIQSDPSWQSLRVKMLPKPSDKEQDFWLGEYARIRQTYDPEDPRDQARAKLEATEYYRKRRKKADKGAIATWEHCFGEGEISAIQHAYNILIDEGPSVFASECQSEPQSRYQESPYLKNTEIRKRLSGFERGIIPPDCTTVTAFIDVQKKALFWMVCAWAEGFTGYVVDYNVFPKQRVSHYTLDSLNPTLARMYPNAGEEGAIIGGLADLTEDLLEKRLWRRADGVIMPIDLLLIDEGAWTELIHKAVMSNPQRSRIMPAMGVAERPTHRVPFAEYKRKPGEKTGGGYPWRIRGSAMTKTLRHVLSEVNWWKSFVQKRFLIERGDPSSLTLYGHDPDEHRLLSNHLTAEYVDRQTSEATGRTLDQWMAKPGKPDNHLLDCLVGNAVAASIQGIKLKDVLPANAHKKGRKRLKLSELQARKNRG